MPRFTLAERAEIIKKYYGNSGSAIKTLREFRRELGRHHGFSLQAIRRTVEKFEREYTLLDIKPTTRQKMVRSEENIAAVAASLEEDPEMSIRQRSVKLGIARESIRLIVQEMKEKSQQECQAGGRAMKENCLKELKKCEANGGAKKRKTKPTKIQTTKGELGEESEKKAI